MGVIEIPEEVVALVESGVAGWLATSARNGVPEATRVTGADVHAKRRSLTLFVPVEQAGKTFDNLRDNGRLAVMFVRVFNYQAVQVKGDVIKMREADERESSRIARYADEFTEASAKIGIPRELTSAFVCWPAMAVEMSVTDLFAQTPGPEAGARWR